MQTLKREDSFKIKLFLNRKSFYDNRYDFGNSGGRILYL